MLCGKSPLLRVSRPHIEEKALNLPNTMAVLNYVSSHGLSIVVLALCFTFFVALKHKHQRHRSDKLPLPPGPPGEPLLGHLRVIPADFSERAYARWSREYKSDILSFHILNQRVLVINSVQAAQELLNRRGVNYSDRPRLALFNEVMGFGEVKAMSLMPWGPSWKLSRRMLQRYLGTSPTRLPHYYQRHLDRELGMLLRRYVDNPRASVKESLVKFATSVLLGTLYGLRITNDDDPSLEAASGLRASITRTGAIGASLVDFFPILRFLPRWLEYAPLKHARDGRQHILQFWNVPFEALKRSEEKMPCMLRDALDEREDQLRQGTEPDMTEHEINGMVGATNAAGQDTIWSSLMVFVFNMVMHPDIQTKAQKALDEVVGHDRLPTLEDRPKLPYIDCLVQETLRWLPTLPLGIAHRSIQDDVYDGYLVPGGSVVIANTYAMTRDENVYHNPDTFDPERFLPVESGGRGEPHPVGTFGFGRRVCPGKLVGELTLWSVIACMLSTMKIEKAVDAKGTPITPMAEFTNGFVQHLNDFPCDILPRDQRSVSLILACY